jgi:hypothetical protein
MKRYNYKTYPLLFLCCLVIVLSGCSDSSTSSEPDEPPGLPSQLTPALIDLSYFTSQNVPNDENHITYKTVEAVAIAGSGIIQAGGLLGSADAFLLFMKSTNQEPEFNNGTWVWSVTVPFGFTKQTGLEFNNEPGNVTIKISATPVSGGVQWDIRYTGLIGEDQLDDFRLISGFTSDDEMKGEWNFFLPEGGNTPFMVYTWEKTSLTEFTMTLTASDGDGVVTIEYEKNGVENWMTFNEGTDSTILYWNESNHSGWIEQQGQRTCYENFQNTACS